MKIREASAADGETLHALNVELQEFERRGYPARRPGDELPRSYIQGLLSSAQGSQSRVFLAQDDTCVVGFLACELREDILDHDPFYVCITDMVVTASRRGQGIGRRLMTAAEDFARGHGARTITVTALFSNQSAQDAYRRLGFHEGAVTFERSVIYKDSTTS